MRLVWISLFVFTTLACGGCNSGVSSSAQQSSVKQMSTVASPELELLKGAWQVIAIEAAGKPVPVDRVQKLNLQYIFESDKLTTRRPDRSDNPSTFTVDTKWNPKRITINQSPPIRAIYAVDGNRLQLCIMVDENPNAGYPTELTSKPSPKTDLLTLERR